MSLSTIASTHINHFSKNAKVVHDWFFFWIESTTIFGCRTKIGNNASANRMNQSGHREKDRISDQDLKYFCKRVFRQNKQYDWFFHYKHW